MLRAQINDIKTILNKKLQKKMLKDDFKDMFLKASDSKRAR